MRIARAWAELMSRLGYERYGAQGGDWGSGISRHLGIVEPARVVGVHVNTLQLSREADPVLGVGGSGPTTDGFNDQEKARLDAGARFLAEGAGYGMLQSTRPQTLSYALTDSPVGQLAWIAEKFHEWSDPRHRPDRDDVLTNVTLYWLTRTAGSSARLYYEAAKAARRAAPPPLRVPTGVAVFPHDIGPPIRRLAERDSNIVHWTEFDRGGHFAAMEVPDLLVGDVRTFFRSLRKI
jgi:pimeloyl-ACP methyl ester carboxylesterase